MVGLVMATLVLLGASADASSTETPAVTWVNGTVNAEFDGVPLDEAVAALEAEVGVEFRGELYDLRDITVRFERARFREVVHRLLGAQNFTITYDATGHPRRVDLLSMPQPRRVSGPTSEDLATVVARHPPIALPPVLATALGMRRTRLTWLLRSGMRHADPAIGAAAASLFVQLVEADPVLRAAVMRTDDARLGQLLRTWARLGVSRAVAAFAARARDPLLRSKARRIQESLRRETQRAAAAPST